MALIKCAECGKRISDKAQACPTCGAPTADQVMRAPPAKKNTGGVALAAGIIIALSVGSMMWTNKQQSDQERAAEKVEAQRVARLTPEQKAAEAATAAANNARSAAADAAKARLKTGEETRINKVSVVVVSISRSLRNPESMKLEFVGANDDASLICVRYRAQNGFGGMTMEQAVYAHGQIDAEPLTWTSECAGKLNSLHSMAIASR